jgi:hypothetical protein
MHNIGVIIYFIKTKESWIIWYKIDTQ